MAVRLFRRTYGSLKFRYRKEVACAVRCPSISIADMAIATRLHELSRTYLSALLLCAMVCLLAACGSGGGGESADSATPNAATPGTATPGTATPGTTTPGTTTPGTASPNTASPSTAVLTWDSVSVPNFGGYRVYYGTAPGTYSQSFGHGLNTGNVTTYEVTGLSSGTRYYFVVTAFDTTGHESGFSNEVFKDIP
jgi:hypothetical protein